jgi:hypothetical protein
LKLDLNTLLHILSPTIQTLATAAITAAAAYGARLFSTLQHKTSQSKVEQLAWRLVTAATQKFTDNTERQQYVLGLLKKQFPRVDSDLLEAAMESAVASWRAAQNAPVAAPMKPEA